MAKKDSAPERDGPNIEPEKIEVKYRMNLYRPNGHIRQDIPKGLLYELSRDWGDIMKVIPSNRFSTVEEIVQMVWEWEKRQFRKSFTRSRKQIEGGIAALLLAGLLEER